MKIIKVDNFNRESVSDDLIAKELTRHYAELIVNFLNERFSGHRSSIFYKAVDDAHKLYQFKP